MKNITIQQYAALPNTLIYDSVLNHLKPKNNFSGNSMDITAMPYNNVKYCIRLLTKVSSWKSILKLFEICFGINEKTFWSTRITQYFAARKYMINEFQRIIKTEEKLLATQSTDDHIWQMAGAEKLRPYSDTLPLVQLGKLLGQYPFDLGRKPYGEIFSLLAQTKTQNEVEAEYQKLSRN